MGGLLCTRQEKMQQAGMMKVREIYDSLETGQSKRAIKICNNLIKQNKNVQLARALKAIALEQSGRNDEALKECTILHQEVPTDEDILRKLAYTYRVLDKRELATEIYENAYKKNPSEPVAQGVFLSYAKEHRYADQRSFAFKLMKQHPKDKKYIFFAILAYVLQVNPQDADPKSINLLMASRTLEKAEKDFSLTTVEELLLAIQVYDLMGEYEKVLALVDKYNDLFKLPGDAVEVRARFQAKQGHWAEAQQHYETLLTELGKDNWRYYLAHLECVCEGNVQDVTKERIQPTFALLDKMQEASAVPLRSVCLGRIDLYHRLYQVDASTEHAEQLLQALNAFTEQFSSKQICFRDLHTYLSQVPEALARQVIDLYASILEKDIDVLESAPSEKLVYRFALLEQLKTKYGYYRDLDEAKTKEVAEAHLHKYQLGLSIPSAKELVETEHQYGDDFALLAAHLYFDLYVRTHCEKKLVMALMILLTAWERSKFNYHIKVMAIRVYCLLGALQPAFELYQSFDCKHIQMDTFTHVLLDDVLTLDIPDCTERFLFPMQRFYSDSLCEVPELMTHPYTRLCYSRARDFSAFHQKIANTLQRATHNLEYTLYDAGHETVSEGMKEILRNSNFRILIDEEKLKLTHSTADNTFWDNWHTIESLASPYIITAANATLSDDGRRQLARVRGLMCHLMAALMEGRLEESVSLHQRWEEAYHAMSFDTSSTPLWEEVKRLLRLSTDLLSVSTELKNVILTEETVPRILQDLTDLIENITKLGEDLLTSSETESLMGRKLPLHQFLVTIITWAQLMLPKLAEDIPNRIRKSAPEPVKQGHQKLRNQLRTQLKGLTEQAHQLGKRYQKLASKNVILPEDLLLPQGCSTPATLAKELTDSCQSSYTTLSKKLLSTYRLNA